MLFTLHKYIFRELIKVFILSAIALTVMMSLGSILRPVQEHGVGPQQVISLMGYFLPITLTFVLPTAALFATALVYGRFASDNEIDACKASGISLLTLVHPGLVLAMMVAIANLLLSFYVMPAFVKRAEHSLTADTKQIIFRNIQRKGYYKPSGGRYLLYADHADTENSILRGVVVAELRKTKIRSVISAQHAKINFNPNEKFNEQIEIIAYKTYQMDSENNSSFYFERLPLTYEFPSLLTDNIRFKKINEMKQIQVAPILFYPVEKKTRNTYAQLVTELLAKDITATTSSDDFYRLNSGLGFVEFKSDQCTAGEQERIELTGNVTVVNATHEIISKYNSNKASLYIEGDKLAPTLTMELYSASWTRSDGTEGIARQPVIRGILLPQTVTNNFVTGDLLKDITANVEKLKEQGYASTRLEALNNQLNRRLLKTLIEIKAEINSRLIFGIGCIAMILIGIALGIILKGGHLLTAFAASCIPLAMLIICIMAGRNVARNLGSAQSISGIMMMWIGLGALVLFTILLYRKLMKN